MRLQAKIMTFALAISALVLPCAIYSKDDAGEKKAKKIATAKAKAESNKGYKEIHTEELKKLLDSKQPVMLIDARKTITVGTLPGAKHLVYDASEQTIKRTLDSASKDATIVVYCARTECPLSKYLAENLVKAGYTNVYKYPEGIEEWMKTYPIDKVK
jgi:rhodanese-related sulfurtransferase